MYSPDAIASRSSMLPDAPTRRTVPPLDPARDFKLFAKIDAEKQRRMPRWRRIFDLMMPDRQAFEMSKQAGQDPTKVVDSYPQYAIQRGIGKIITALFFGKWFDVEAGDEIPEEQHDDVNQALEWSRDVAFKAIDRSDFSSELPAALLDVFAADGAMLVERGPNINEPVICKTVPLNEQFPIAGAGGRRIGMMRKYECEAASLEEEFGGYGRKLDIPQMVRDKVASDPAAKVCILEVTRTVPNVGQRLTVYLWDNKHVLLDHVGRDPDEPSRWVTGGWTKVAGEIFHRGPADTALATCENFNFVMESKSKATAKRIDPPLAVDVDANMNTNTLSLTPQAVVEYSSALLNGNPPFQGFPVDALAIEYTREEIASLKADIDRYLFARETLPSVPESHQMTAEEVRTRAQQTLREEGADFSHLNSGQGFGPQFASRLFWVLRTWGKVPPYLKFDGKLFVLRPAGPLASAQAADDATNDIAFIGRMGALLGPEAMHLGIKTEDVPSIIGDKLNVSRGLIRGKDEREKMMQAAAQALAAQQQAATAAQGQAA